MKRYKNDIDKIKSSDEIKQQTILMMQKNLTDKNVSYKRNFRLALSASLVLFVSTALLSAAFLSQRFNSEDVPIEAQHQEMYMQADEIPEGMAAKAQVMESSEFEPMMMAEPPQENLLYEQDRIICGKIILIDEAFIDVDGMKVYTDNYTVYKDDIASGNNVEILVCYIESEPYAEWIELSEN